MAKHVVQYDTAGTIVTGPVLGTADLALFESVTAGSVTCYKFENATLSTVTVGSAPNTWGTLDGGNYEFGYGTADTDNYGDLKFKFSLTEGGTVRRLASVRRRLTTTTPCGTMT